MPQPTRSTEAVARTCFFLGLTSIASVAIGLLKWGMPIYPDPLDTWGFFKAISTTALILYWLSVLWRKSPYPFRHIVIILMVSDQLNSVREHIFGIPGSWEHGFISVGVNCLWVVSCYLLYFAPQHATTPPEPTKG